MTPTDLISIADSIRDQAIAARDDMDAIIARFGLQRVTVDQLVCGDCILVGSDDRIIDSIGRNPFEGCIVSFAGSSVEHTLPAELEVCVFTEGRDRLLLLDAELRADSGF